MSTAEKEELARAAGAAEVIRYTEVDDLAGEVRALTGGAGVAAVYDGVGRTTFDASLASLRLRGMLVLFGASSGPVPPVDPQRLNAAGSVFLTRPKLYDHIATREELLGAGGRGVRRGRRRRAGRPDRAPLPAGRGPHRARGPAGPPDHRQAAPAALTSAPVEGRDSSGTGRRGGQPWVETRSSSTRSRAWSPSRTTTHPKLEVPAEVAEAMGMSRKADHGVILRCVSTNICGSDQHMVRGRTTAPPGQTLGHEITGEVVEKGSDVQFLEVGDICTVPFNIACGRCRNCREGATGVCLNVNPARAGSAYGYVDMGGWEGGQAEYVMVPFADFNLLKFPDRDQALEKILDLTMLSDIFPTGYHGAYTAGVTTGSTVYVAGRRAGRAGRGLLGAAARRRGGDRRGPQRGPAGPGPLLRLRDGRHLQDATLEDQIARSSAPTRWTARSTRSGSRPPGTAAAAARRRPRCSTRSWR